MPIFEFYCQDCNKEFEELVFNDKNPVCPQCQSVETAKMISRPCRNRASSSTSSGASPSITSSSSCGGCSASSCSGCGSR